MKRALFIAVFLLMGGVYSMASDGVELYDAIKGKYVTENRVIKTDEEWREVLPPEVYRITRGSGTELACSGEFYNNDEPGLYVCAVCGNHLFYSTDKFHSGTGWPSYLRPVDSKNIITRKDSSHGMERIEVLCARCESHLGHVFDDGPPPAFKRYCINSLALKFLPEEEVLMLREEMSADK